MFKPTLYKPTKPNLETKTVIKIDSSFSQGDLQCYGVSLKSIMEKYKDELDDVYIFSLKQDGTDIECCEHNDYEAIHNNCVLQNNIYIITKKKAPLTEEEKQTIISGYEKDLEEYNKQTEEYNKTLDRFIEAQEQLIQHKLEAKNELIKNKELEIEKHKNQIKKLQESKIS